MSKTYTIRRLPEDAGRYELSGVFCPDQLPEEYKALEEARLDNFPWDENGYKPDCRARVGWNEQGLHVLMYANEPIIRALVMETGGEVCEDSCLEFFLQPFADDPHYMNFETNAAGVALIGLCVDRYDMKFLDAMPEGMDIRASKHEGGWWAVAYTIPYALIEKLYGRRPEPGAAMRANFYKCDESVHPHFGSWNPVKAAQPDFHRPECFGPVALEM